MKKFISIVGLICLIAATLHAQGTTSQTGDRIAVTLSDPARPATLRVSMVNGGMSVKSHNGKDILIEGRSAGRGRPNVTSDGLRRIDSGRSGLVVVEENNVVTVSNAASGGGGNLEILVPRKTNLTLSTVNGSSIVVEDIEGDVEVSNTNGTVRLIGLTGSVVANAGNGNLTAVFRELTGNKPLSFVSMNGNVDVTLPASATANVRIRTNSGDAWTDFDLERQPGGIPRIENDPNRRGQFRVFADTTIDGTINGGGRSLELRTLNGNVFLRKAK